MTQILRLIKTDSDFLDKCANKVSINGEEWLYMPFWFKKEGDGLFSEYRFEQLPDYMKEGIKNQRELKNK